MLTKMSREELIKEVEKLQDEIELLHEELRMVYKAKQKIVDRVKDIRGTSWQLYRELEGI